MRHFCRVLFGFVGIAALVVAAGCNKEEKTSDQAQNQQQPQVSSDTSDQSVPPIKVTLAGADTTAVKRSLHLPPWEDTIFADFVTIKHANFALHYPATHQHADQMVPAAEGYKTALAKVSEMLGMPEPTDTIHVYALTGPGQGRIMSGNPFPFGDSQAVYYWPNYSRGPSLMQHLLYKYFGGRSKHEIMNHGLIALFDFGGTNYHATTLEFLREGEFIPLAKLVEDTLMNSTIERYQSAEAGSFVAFLLAFHGTTGVKAIYDAPLPFAYAVQSNLKIGVDSLQREWITFIERTVGPIDTTMTVPPQEQVAPIQVKPK